MVRTAPHGGSAAAQTCRSALAGLLALALVLVTVPSASAGIGTWTQQDLAGQVVSAVAVDPTNPNVIFAGTRGSGVFRSLDMGRTWTPINGGLDNLFVNDLAVDPTTPTILYAGTGESAAKGDANSGLYRSTNRGDSWTRQLDGHVASIAINPQNPSIVYAGGAPPVSKSTDRGVTWAPAFDGIANTDVNGVAVDPESPDVVLAGGATEGGSGNIFRSTNAGGSWTRVVSAESGQPAISDVAFAASGHTAFASAFGNLLRSGDGGVTWSTILTGRSLLAVRPNPANAAEVFLGTTDAGVLRSNNGGTAFSSLDTSLGNRGVRALALDRAAQQTIYAGTDNGVFAFTFPRASFPVTPRATWYFAEGSTQPPFDTWFLLQNPGSVGANVRVTYQRPDGSQLIQFVTVGPTSRFSIYANQVIPNTPISTRIDSDQPIFAERSLFFRFDGTVVTGVAAPAQTWYLAEGSTQNPFHTWILLQNPNDQPATVTLTFQKQDGTLQTLTRSMPPTSRDAVFANQFVPAAAFATRVDADRPIVVERAMYLLSPDGRPIGGGHGVAGVTAPSQTWAFAEGLTGSFRGRPFDSWLLLQNPNGGPVDVNIRLLETNGNVRPLFVRMDPTSRQSVYLNQFIQGSFGITVDASAPIIAERARFYGFEPFRGADATVGATSLATTWDLPEGSTQPPFDEVIAILNPSSQAMAAHVDFFMPDGSVVGRDFAIGPTRKLSIDVDEFIPNAPVSARVTTSVPSVVERTMFFVKGGLLGSTNTVGIAQ